MSDLVPTHGVRVLLERGSTDDAGASYAVEIHAPASSWRSEARLAVAGAQIALGPWRAIRGEGGEPEPWMIESARGFLRTVLKNAAVERDPALRDWPPRQLRWRDRR